LRQCIVQKTMHCIIDAQKKAPGFAPVLFSALNFRQLTEFL